MNQKVRSAAASALIVACLTLVVIWVWPRKPSRKELSNASFSTTAASSAQRLSSTTATSPIVRPIAHSNATLPLTSKSAAPQRQPDVPDAVEGKPGKVVPHPMDALRQRMAEQRRLFANVKQALASDDFARARELLVLHDVTFGAEESWTDLREGYERILDCQQQPGPESRASGQQFVDRERGSTLRRRVRRACLAPQ